MMIEVSEDLKKVVEKVERLWLSSELDGEEEELRAEG
jgi:hypothetical protein